MAVQHSVECSWMIAVCARMRVRTRRRGVAPLARCAGRARCGGGRRSVASASPALGWLTEKVSGDGGERWAIREKALHTLMAGRDSLLLAGPRDYFVMTGRPAVSDPSRFLPCYRRLSATFPWPRRLDPFFFFNLPGGKNLCCGVFFFFFPCYFFCKAPYLCFVSYFLYSNDCLATKKYQQMN